MKKLIVDDKIVLIPMTSQLYHIERKNYIADPMMCYIIFYFYIDLKRTIVN